MVSRTRFWSSRVPGMFLFWTVWFRKTSTTTRSGVAYTTEDAVTSAFTTARFWVACGPTRRLVSA
jgi:hypothetical protein